MPFFLIDCSHLASICSSILNRSKTSIIPRSYEHCAIFRSRESPFKAMRMAWAELAACPAGQESKYRLHEAGTSVARGKNKIYSRLLTYGKLEELIAHSTLSVEDMDLIWEKGNLDLRRPLGEEARFNPCFVGMAKRI